MEFAQQIANTTPISFTLIKAGQVINDIKISLASLEQKKAELKEIQDRKSAMKRGQDPSILAANLEYYLSGSDSMKAMVAPEMSPEDRYKYEMAKRESDYISMSYANTGVSTVNNYMGGAGAIHPFFN